MPPPGYGTGSAFSKPGGMSEKAKALAVVTARTYASMSLEQVDAAERPIIAKVISSSCMSKERKQASLANIRNALRLCRSGVDPMARERNQCECTQKTVKTHLFLCTNRDRAVKGQGEDREAALRRRVEADLEAYLQLCRSLPKVRVALSTLALSPRARLAPPPSHARSQSRSCASALCSLPAGRAEGDRRGRCG